MFYLLLLISSLINIKSTGNQEVYRFTFDDSLVSYAGYLHVTSSSDFLYHNAGAPSIPYYTFIIPARGNMKSLELTDINTEEMDGKLLPLPSFNKKGMVNSYRENPSFYEKSYFIPDKVIENKAISIRGRKYYRIRIYPVAFNPKLNRIKITKNFNLHISWTNNKKQTKSSFLFRNILKTSSTFSTQTKNGIKTTSFFDSALIWFKIPILNSGAYRISYSDLRNKGLLASFSISDICLYSRGPDTFQSSLSANDFYAKEIPLLIQDANNDGTFDEGDYIIFYAEGPYTWRKEDTTFTSFHNPYTDTTFYWLGFGKNGLTIKTLPYQNASSISSAYAFYHHEKDITNIAWKGILWEGESIIRFQGNSSGETDFSFNINNVKNDSAVLRIRLIGGESIQRTVLIETQALTDTFSPTGYFITERQLYPLMVHEGSNNFTVKIKRIEGQDDSYGDQIYLDWYDVIYKTGTEGDSDRELFIRGNGSFTFPIGNAKSLVFNITNPLSPYLLGTNVSSGKYYAYDTTSSISRYYIAKDYRTPEIILESDAGKLYTDNYTGTDMLIITSRELLPALWKYKSYRELNFPVLRDSLWEKGTGHIKIVTTQDIYRDFGFGLHDPVAIRNFIYHVYNATFNNGTPSLKFLLMVGDGTYDYRGIESKEGNIVPPFEPFETADINVYAEANETFYADMTDDNFPDLFYGRVTARTESEVAAYFNKVMAYEQQNAASPYRERILLVSDDERGPYGGDSEASWHVPQAEALYTNYTPQNAEKVIVYETDYGSAQNPEERGRLAKAALINAMNSGALIMGFYGHSNPVQMTHEMLFTINDVSLINTHGKPPLCVILTCKFGAFARIEPPRVIAEDWVLNPNGVLGVIASPNATFAFSNGTTGRRIFGFSLDGKIHPLGEVSLSGGDPSYYLLGDPTAFFCYPEKDSKLNFTSQNDTLYSGMLSQTSIDGNFYGEFLTTIIGNPKIKTYYTYPNNYVLRYHTSTPILFRGSLTKQTDTLPFKFFLPYNADTGIIHINTLRAENEIMEQATSPFELKKGTPVSDIQGPTISLKIGNTEVTSGKTINTPLSFTITAQIQDSHGINLQGIGEEKGVYLVLNNTTYDLAPYFRYSENSYTSGEVSYSISLENEGEYDASLVAYDNLGNRSQITFKIYAEEGSQKLSDILIYPNPIRGNEGTHITFKLEKGANIHVSIYSISGTLIYRSNESFYPAGFNSIYWDGRDMFGDLPASGLYIVVLNINTDGKRTKIRKGLFIERR